MSLIWRPGFQFDVDASAYIEAVEAADEIASPGIGALETGVRYAINNFVIGCKQDGIWDAIKASCILAGARTLAGALVPLAGAAPTNYNFVAGDYNRKTGLKGDGVSKSLLTGRLENDDPQDNRHVSVFYDLASGGNNKFCISTPGDSSTATSYIWRGANLACKASQAGLSTFFGAAVGGFQAISRTGATSVQLRANGASQASSAVSQPPSSLEYEVWGHSSLRGSWRQSFYSIGESLDLAALDGRVTDLMTAIGAAIP